MGQFNLLDQLSSKSAFNDCSVTGIYSGVILITDVLLLCKGRVTPWPPLLSCAHVIVCFGTTLASFTVVLLFILLLLLNARCLSGLT